MVPLLVGAQLVVLVGMVAVSVWGRKHIAPETRIPVRLGTSGFDWTMSKNTTLLWTPGIGLLILLATLTLRDSVTPETFAGAGLALMVMFLAAHASSVKRAAR